MDNKFTLCGRIVTHTAPPKFSVTFIPRADGSWQSTDVKFPADNFRHLGDPDETAQTLARLVREAGDFFAAHVRADWIQRACIARARSLGLTAYAVAKATGGAVSENHVRGYLAGEKSMGSHKLQHVLRVLGLTVAVDH